jgi:hypothetical protein
MPYEIETQDGIVLRNIPDNIDPQDDRLKSLVAKERSGRRERSPEFQAKVKAQEAEDRERYDPTKGLSKTEKVLINLGAGVDTAWQGFKQIAPGFKGMSDEELREKRERDKRLAKSTETGAGADWVPSIGSVLQFAGEVAPSLIVPGGVAGGAARGASVLTRALASPTVMGAAGGAASGLLSPVTSDESRTLNTALGAAGGAALPGALAAWRGTRGLGSAEGRAARQLERVAGDDAPNIMHDVAQRAQQRAQQARGVRDIPETLAEASGSTRMARLENQLGRDAATADEMSAFARNRNVARHAAIERATSEAPLLGPRDIARGAATDPMRSQALAAAGRDPWFHTPVIQAVQDVLARPDSVNPAVRRVADEVMRNIDERAPTALTPERLYAVRKLLTDKLTGPTAIGDELSNAVKGANRETAQLVRAIDQALDQSSGGQFTPYLREFHAQSRGVDAARAAGTVRERFNQYGNEQLGGAPLVSRHRLSQAVRASEERGRKFPLRLSQSARGQLDDVMEHLQRSEEVQNATLAGSARGGSRTSTDIESVLQRLAKGTTSIPGLSHVIEAVTSRASDATKMELARLIQNPEQAVAAIARARQANMPLTEAQQHLLTALARGAGGAGAGALGELAGQ